MGESDLREHARHLRIGDGRRARIGECAAECAERQVGMLREEEARRALRHRHSAAAREPDPCDSAQERALADARLPRDERTAALRQGQCGDGKELRTVRERDV